ncbi:GAF and ANTAR domain-containing protein [Geodermatophilus sp. SYSU D01186]
MIFDGAGLVTSANGVGRRDRRSGRNSRPLALRPCSLVSACSRHAVDVLPAGCREVGPAVHADPSWIEVVVDSSGMAPIGRPADSQAAFAELAKIMRGARAPSETLCRIAELAKQALPGVADASVTLMRVGAVSTVSYTGPLAALLDERQYAAGSGPCVDAAISGDTITIDDTTASGTYPDFGRLAHRHGITHTMSVGLPVERRIIGALNLYGGDETTFDGSTAELATAFASSAAVAVANAGVHASTGTLVRNLQKALDARAVIDQAKGVLMAQHGWSPEVAFDQLVRQSNSANRKLRDIAQDVVDAAQRGQPQ